MVALLVQEMRLQCRNLNVEDYRLFSMALTQRYISPLREELSTDFLSQFMDKQGPKKFGRRAFAALPEPEKERLRAAIRDFHDRMLEVFQRVPAKLMLVMRNLNTIRAVTKVGTVPYRTYAPRYLKLRVLKLKADLFGGAMPTC